MTALIEGGCPTSGTGRHLFIRRGIACVMCGEAMPQKAQIVTDRRPGRPVKYQPPTKPQSISQFERLFERDGNECHYCRTPVAMPVSIKGTAFPPVYVGNVRLIPVQATRDHVVPRGAGGRNTIQNLVLACAFCNQNKGMKSKEEWMASEKFIQHKKRIDGLRNSTLKLDRAIKEHHARALPGPDPDPRRRRIGVRYGSRLLAPTLHHLWNLGKHLVLKRISPSTEDPPAQGRSSVPPESHQSPTS